MLKKTFIILLSLLSAALQFVTAILLEEKRWILAALCFMVPAIVSALLYNTVPTTKKLLHGLLELLCTRINRAIGATNKEKQEQYGIRCSILVPRGRPSNRVLGVVYRYPRSGSSIALNVSDKNGRLAAGVAGKAYRSKKFQKAPNIPFEKGKVNTDWWEKEWNIHDAQVNEFNNDEMRSIYCWPIKNGQGECVAVLSIDSKCAETLNPKLEGEIREDFIPLLEDAYSSLTQSGIVDMIKGFIPASITGPLWDAFKK